MPKSSLLETIDAPNKHLFRVAVLFTGGKSSRMGKDKSLLPFGGYETLCEYQFYRLKRLFSEVYISTKSAKFGFEAPLIFDTYSQTSPLVGLISFFESTPYESCFILSVDAPFVDESVIARLFQASSDPTLDAIIAQSPEGTQPLCGIYRRTILTQAKQFLAEENHKLGALLKAAKTQFVSFEAEEPFTNLNHPHEYEAAIGKLNSN